MMRPKISGHGNPRLEYDEEAKALYVTLCEGKSTRTETVSMNPTVILDVNEHDQLIGIEILL